MRWYPDHIPDWISRWFSSYQWHGDRELPCIYLTFDDGPTPIATPFVLNQLAVYNFKATFFLIGDRVLRHTDLKEKVLQGGHSIGNHTHNHWNAWKTNSQRYLDNVAFAKAYTSNKLFRPPYGKITPTIANALIQEGYKIIMWDVLSGDFDTQRTPESCLAGLKKHTKPGSIVVFHDSEKAFPLLKVVLPEYLDWLKENQWSSQCL